MKPEELRELSDDQLREKISDLKETIFRLRFKLSLGETSALKNYREAKKDLARVKTILRERQLNIR